MITFIPDVVIVIVTWSWVYFRSGRTSRAVFFLGKWKSKFLNGLAVDAALTQEKEWQLQLLEVSINGPCSLVQFNMSKCLVPVAKHQLACTDTVKHVEDVWETLSGGIQSCGKHVVAASLASNDHFCVIKMEVAFVTCSLDSVFSWPKTNATAFPKGGPHHGALPWSFGLAGGSDSRWDQGIVLEWSSLGGGKFEAEPGWRARKSLGRAASAKCRVES